MYPVGLPFPLSRVSCERSYVDVEISDNVYKTAVHELSLSFVVVSVYRAIYIIYTCIIPCSP